MAWVDHSLGREPNRRARVLFALALATVLATLLAGAGPSPAAKPPPSFYGIAAQGSITAEDILRMKTAGVGHYRLLLSWPAVERTKGHYDWTNYDRLITELTLAGIEPLAHVFGVPTFYPGKDAEPPIRSAQALAGWNRFLRATAARYGADGVFWDTFALLHPGIRPQPLEIWEVWNEENAKAFWSPKPNVGEYAKLLTESASALHSVDPDAEIMTGGMFAEPTSRGSITSYDLLRGLFKKRAVKRVVDMVGVHPYAPNIKGVKEQMNKTYSLMRKARAAKGGTWVTELSWGSDPRANTPLAKTPRQQATLLGQSFDMLAGNRAKWKVQGVTWYTWHDDTSGARLCNWCATAGLLNDDRQKKPAFNAFTKRTGGN